jgi:alpha-glucoside transport system substrate-binding protein
MEDIWLAEEYVHGGAAGILSQPFNESALRLFDDPPGCYFNRQASFIVAFFPEDAVFGEDYDFFFLPPIDEEYGRPVLGGGDLMSMINDRPEVREVMRWLATGESVRPLVEAGSQISPHRDAAFEWYSSPVQLRVAEILFEADTYRFDASDMMPREVGSGAFWQGIIEWVGGKDLGQVLQTIDERWPAENGD